MKEIINNFLILLLIPFMAQAQSADDKGVVTGTCDSIRFTDNFYFETNLGTQLLFNKDADKLSFKERFTPSFSLTCGKWFSPYTGLRFGIQGYSLNGFSTVEGLYLADRVIGTIYGNNDPVRDNVTIRPDGSYRRFLRYVNMHLDFQLNLSNLFREYNDQLRWDVIPSLGLGYMRVMEYKGVPNANIISANFGVAGKYHLNSKIDINAEVTGSVLPDQFDGRITGNIYEGYGSAGVGITYYFGKRGFKHSKTSSAPVALLPKEVIIKDTVYIEKNANTTGSSDRFEQPLSVTPDTAARNFNLSIIQFRSESSLPASGQDLAIRNIAEFLEQNPNAKIRLDGYCDNKTGTKDFNMNLAQRRAESIFNILVNKYNIDSKRLEIKVIGSSNQPFEKAKWNRIVIAVAEER